MDNADSVIKFRCENCGQKFSVHKNNAGKKGRCPKCNNIVIVPELESTNSTLRQGDSEDSKINSKYSAYDLSLLAMPQKEIAQDASLGHPDTSGNSDEYNQGPEEESAEETTALYRLPWFVDIFLYPISASGLVNLAILSFLPRMLPPLGHLDYWMHPPPLLLAIIVILVGYFIYCLSDYIRDSADGKQRAPDIELSLSILTNAWELVWLILNTFICVAVCVGPLVAYLIITKQTDIIFWLLVTYGVLYLPMVLLGLVLFESLRALNPILIITSMFNVFLPYCGLVLLFFAVCGIIAIMLVIMPQSFIISYLLSAVCIYLTMIMAHLLGRFCYKYSERLNWEV
ncbi:MAG: TFIIB-type zinc ribbon-containing protein [Planctomycetota bacterium]|jgi:DNA-directed RNA polymerase subunit RPC12/RpoP